jgi:DNA-directed RNA polymerase subunit RPC12/RpoP
MSKYNIEDGIDFFTELYNNESSDNEDVEDENTKCLITNQQLTDKHIILNCGHKFNYMPLYHDLLNHKTTFNNMEYASGQLNVHEIRCPYCRKKQIGVLPYYECLGLKKINGVNFYDSKIDKSVFQTSHDHCKYQSLNENFDSTKPESSSNTKYVSCPSCYVTKIHVYNPINSLEPITYGDEQHYCYIHIKKIIKKHKNNIAILEKEEAKKLKEEAKKLKEETKKLKGGNKKQMSVENIVLDNNEVGCVAILKTGVKKGNVCGCKIYTENICLRHFQINKNNK